MNDRVYSWHRSVASSSLAASSLQVGSRDRGRVQSVANKRVIGSWVTLVIGQPSAQIVESTRRIAQLLLPPWSQSSLQVGSRDRGRVESVGSKRVIGSWVTLVIGQPSAQIVMPPLRCWLGEGTPIVVDLCVSMAFICWNIVWLKTSVRDSLGPRGRVRENRWGKRE
jgi:hypothetical protein